MIENRFGDAVCLCLLTRVNIFDPTHRVLHASKTANSKGEADASGARRLARFSEFCLASVINLRLKPDLWLILMDEQTPGHLVNTYAELVAGHGEIVILKRPAAIWLWEPRYYTRNLKRAIAHRIPQKSSHVATFGLDDDDALRSDFFEVPARYLAHGRAAALGDERFVVNVPYGYIDTGKFLTIRSVSSNMFAGRIEPRRVFEEDDDGAATIYAVPHPVLPMLGTVINLAVRRPSWLKVSHFGNLALRNDFAAELDGFPIVAPQGEWAEFGISRERDAGEGWRVAAANLRRAGRHDDAAAAIARALSLDCPDPASFHEAALAAACKGRPEEARDFQEKALTIDERWIVSDYWLVHALMTGYAFAAARDRERGLRRHVSTTRHEIDLDQHLLSAAAEECGDWAWPLVYLGRAMERRDRSAAMACFRQAAEREPGWAPVWTELGRTLLYEGRNDEACAAFARSVELDGRQQAAWMGLGSSRFRLQQWHAAVDAFEAGFRSWVESAPPEWAFYELGHAYQLTGRDDDAEKAFRHGSMIFTRSARLQDALR